MTAPVVLLTKPDRLGLYLAQRLATEVNLKAVFFEVRQGSWRYRWQHTRRLIRSEGLLRSVNIVAYQAFEALLRGREYAAVCDAVLGDVPSLEGVETFSFANLNSPEARSRLASFQPDVIVVHATGILRPETYGIARLIAMNVHCGVLPEYRGHASTFWALRRHDFENVGVTVHEVAPKVDTGRVVRLGRVAVQPDDTDATAWIKAFRLGVNLTVDAIRQLAASGTVSFVEAPPGQPGPHYPRRALTDHIAYVWSRYRARRARMPAHR